MRQSTHEENSGSRPLGADALMHESSAAASTILIVEDDAMFAFAIDDLPVNPPPKRCS